MGVLGKALITKSLLIIFIKNKAAHPRSVRDCKLNNVVPVLDID
jgi:hypothetical protein